MNPHPPAAPDTSAPTPPQEAACVSRRELLKKAGWVVPALVVLPLTPGPLHARGGGFASPGGKSSDVSLPTPSKDLPSPSRGSGSSGSDEGPPHDPEGKKKEFLDWLKKLLEKLKGRR